MQIVQYLSRQVAEVERSANETKRHEGGNGETHEFHPIPLLPIQPKLRKFEICFRAQSLRDRTTNQFVSSTFYSRKREEKGDEQLTSFLLSSKLFLVTS